MAKSQQSAAVNGTSAHTCNDFIYKMTKLTFTIWPFHNHSTYQSAAIMFLHQCSWGTLFTHCAMKSWAGCARFGRDQQMQIKVKECCYWGTTPSWSDSLLQLCFTVRWYLTLCIWVYEVWIKEHGSHKILKYLIQRWDRTLSSSWYQVINPSFEDLINTCKHPIFQLSTFK